jgi:sulfonate transport system substrate-binding protein
LSDLRAPALNMKRLRIGGVPEHFSLPVKLAQDKGAISCEFVAQPGGTGEMIHNLTSPATSDTRIDVAIALTEGLVLATQRGDLKGCRIVSVFVESPLQWGIHTGPHSIARSVADLDPCTCRIAISRHMSGSHLMSWVFAKAHHWPVEQLHFVVVGGLTGALNAFEEGRVDLFLWDRFMTTPVVKDGSLKLLGSIDSPWPCFCVAATDEVVEKRGDELMHFLEAVLREGRHLRDHTDEMVAVLAKLHRLSEPVAREWLAATEYAVPHSLPDAIAKQICEFIPH